MLAHKIHFILLINYDYYLKQVEKKHPEFSGIFSAKDRKAELVKLAEKNNRGVFADNHVSYPKGYTRIPIGIAWQWLPDNMQIEHRAVAGRLLLLCSRWADPIFQNNNPERKFANAIKKSVFLFPVMALQNAFPGQLGQLFHEVVKLFEVRNTTLAAQQCARYLQVSGIQIDPKNLGY